VIPESTPLLLDTGIIVLLCRGQGAGRVMEERFGLLSRRTTPWISVISVGEIFAFAERNQWGASRRQLLHDLLENVVVVDINRRPVIESYAHLDAYVTTAGRRMGQQNDLWIAATAAATGAVLITTDKDFDDLHPAHLAREWVDPTSLR
jgi:tRNA(fMet)-specific endonuclease VapC